MKKENVPGIFVGVVKSDSVLFRKEFGFSDIENNVPVTPRTCMELGSVSKIFTAEAIINLSSRKLLNLNDPVTKYIKNAPSEWSSITINHLLMHASGIQNYLLDSRFKADVLFQPDSPDTLLNVFLNSVSTDRMTEAFFSLPLEFSPGETWSYSNTGYYLLGKIAESVISGNFFDYAADSTFIPMNMVNVNTGEHALKNRCLSKGYINTAEGLKRARTLTGNYAFSAGAWAVTGDDMIKFLKFLHLKKLPSDKAGYDWKTQITYKNHPFTYNGGRFFGIFHGKHIICHNGGT
jgi:CubicO group peptidase (beta-lactamase class C family)